MRPRRPHLCLGSGGPGVLLAAALLLGPLGCRGDRSSDPPIHLNPNMDNQQRLDPQEPHSFSPDHRAMRKPVKGTVARGGLRTDRHLHLGKVDSGFAQTLPSSIRLEPALLARGRERYNIFCASCHDRLGTGQGIVYRVNAGLPRPASFQDRRLQAAPLGQLVYTIVRGKSNMQPLGYAIPAADRWAIATYIRALQHSQNAKPKAGPAPEER